MAAAARTAVTSPHARRPRPQVLPLHPVRRQGLSSPQPRALRRVCTRTPITKPLPCIKSLLSSYCHGNAGCRLDALSVVPVLLPENISVFAFDFSGAGLSDGDYLSLGYYEKADVSTVVDFLKASTARSPRLLFHSSAFSSLQCLPFPSPAPRAG